MLAAALRSLIKSSRVVLGWFLTALMIIETPRGEILQGSPDRGRLTVILCFFHLWIITPTVVTFSPSCLAMVCSPFQPCVGLQSCPWHPWTALWSWPWWRVQNLIDWSPLGTSVFYTGNKLNLSSLTVKKDTWEPEILLIDSRSNTYFTHLKALTFFKCIFLDFL